MTEQAKTSLQERYFSLITTYPKIVLVLCFILAAFFASQMPRLVKDASVDAFIPPEQETAIYRHKVERIFGLKDPMAIAVVNDTPEGIFNPKSLALIAWITRELEAVPNVDPDRITSIASAKNIVGTEEGLTVTPFLEQAPETQDEARHVRDAVMDIPLYTGTLVAKDGTGALIIFEVLDAARAEETYEAAQEMLKRAPATTEQMHVAGEGAVGGYWSAVIDRDSRRLQPLAGLVIAVIMWLAFRTKSGVLMPLAVVLATVIITMGAMALAGVPYYAITNSLTVLLIGMAVADSIHILSQYYEELAHDPMASAKELVIRTMMKISRPVLLTSLTTFSGFMGIVLTSSMPPMIYFALFAMLGVTVALLYSLTLLPAVLTLMAPRISPAFASAAHEPGSSGPRPDIYARVMTALGTWSVANSKLVLAASLIAVLAGGYSASQLMVERARITNINPDQPLYKADTAINKRFDGTSYIDVVVETNKDEALYNPKFLNRMDAMQRHLETLPHVQGSTSIVDYLKQMNRAMNANAQEAYRIPESEDLVAQYFLLYSATSDPADFKEVVDYNYKTANIRFYMNSGLYTHGKFVVEEAERYAREEFKTDGLSAVVNGRVTVDYHWIEALAATHFWGVGLALVIVLVLASLSFKSLAAGVFTVIPVFVAVLLVYAVMAVTGITLEPATSMFAAIAIGLGIDFSIHTVERLILLMREQGRPLNEAIQQIFPTTGRALFFNFAAIFLGFGVLLTSELPTIQRFGGMIDVAILAGFLASLIILPTLAAALKPAFLDPASVQRAPLGVGQAAVLPTVLLALALPLFVLPTPASAAELPSGDEVAANIDAREESTSSSRTLRMILINSSGDQRVRDTRVFRRDFGAEKKVVLFFQSPSRLKGTAFLTWDLPAGTEDAQWLYLPAARKVRRISASDRGDYFLGTDFTYEDIKRDTKLSLDDYTFKTLGAEDLDGAKAILLEATPKTPEIARDIGYGRVLARVRTDIWMPVLVEYWDKSGNPLKTVRLSDIQQQDGIWGANRVESQNVKTGHRTVFEYLETSYNDEFDNNLFTEQGLKRGL